MTSLLRDARERKYAVGYFESWNYESTMAVVAAAEDARSPVIIGFNAGILTDSQRILPPENLTHYAAMGNLAARGASVPVALILNEIPAMAMAMEGVRLGFDALLFEDETKPLSENVTLVRGLVEAAHAADVAVEGNVGRLPVAVEGGSSPNQSDETLTRPEDAERFVAETGIDALGVAVGNVEVLTHGKATMRLDLLERIAAAVGVPLVLHGGSGIPDEIVGDLIARGVAKINLGAVLNESFFRGMNEVLETREDYVSPKYRLGSGLKSDILAGGFLAMKETVKKKMAVYGSVGKAPRSPSDRGQHDARL